MKLIEQTVPYDKLSAAMVSMDLDLAKACKLIEVTPISLTGGDQELTYGDGFKAFAAPYLKKHLELTTKQVRALMDEHDITFKNTAQIVRLSNARFLSIKLRLHDLRREFLDCVER